MRALILLIASLLSMPAFAHKVIRIADGDTLTLLVENKPVKIRLANIDAPERRQAFGSRSRESLSELCWGTDASYEVQDVDRYGRVVGTVTCAGVQVNRAQVERGMAWVYGKYNKDASLPRLEREARQMRRGLWRDPNPVAPWEYRRQGREQRQKERDDARS